MNALKTTVLLIIILLSACGSDEEETPNCSADTNISNAYDSARSAYSASPTIENCQNLRNAAQNVLNDVSANHACLRNQGIEPSDPDLESVLRKLINDLDC